MAESEFKFFDFQRLVERINGNLDNDEEPLELGDFIRKEPRRNPFLYSLRQRELESRGKYHLIQVAEQSPFPMSYERNAGYIFVEKGLTDIDNSEPSSYETIRFRLKRQLQLRKGLYIPSCSVKILIEQDEWSAPKIVERRDHIRQRHLVWQRTDLLKVLPTEWFLSKSALDDYMEQREKEKGVLAR